MPTVLINPLNETQYEPRPAAPKLATLNSTTIGLLDISKPGGSYFLDHVERLLKERFRVAQVVRAMKPTFTKPAPVAILETFINARCDAVIEALAD
jgi:DNA-binding LacI/PurR family transcriptional regulator